MSPPRDPVLQPHDTFDGRFTINRVLGHGNFATVYHATQTVCGVRLRSVALKVFAAGAVTASNAREVFQDALVLLGLMAESPAPEIDRHLIQILDGGAAAERGGQAFLAMELVRGQTLDQAVRRFRGMPEVGGIPLDLSLTYLRQILVPLAWMHALDPVAVHGDLHFGNVLITEQGLIKLADFGLAARLPAPVFGGAMKCQAPETLLGQPGDASSDVYALGLLWYEMLTGGDPFHEERLDRLQIELASLGEEARELEADGRPEERRRVGVERGRKQSEYVRAQIQARQNGFRRPSEINRTLADHLGLEDILLRCLEYSPAHRYHDAGQVMSAIEAYLEGGGGPGGWLTAAPEPEEPWELPEETPERLLEQARRMTALEDYDGARRAVERVIAVQGESAAGWLAKARIAMAQASRAAADPQRLIDEAFEAAAEAQKRAPEEPAFFEVMAELYRADGKPRFAENMERRKKELADRRARARHGRR